jgi:hypothetical protein
LLDKRQPHEIECSLRGKRPEDGGVGAEAGFLESNARDIPSTPRTGAAYQST